MLELVQITAQYSNAVLVAVLPYVSTFAQKLDLPIKTPVIPAQVSEFRCDPRKDRTGGAIFLTNGFQFTFLDGRIRVYRSPESYFSLQDPSLVPKLYGKVKINEKEALRIARESIRKLGYTETELHTDAAPQIIPPEQVETNYIPRYRFRWLDPHWPGAKDSGVVPATLDIEVNAVNGRIEMLSVVSRESRRPNPKVDVQPPMVENSKNAQQEPAAGKAVWAGKEYAVAMLNAVLPQISDFIKKGGLPVSVPLSTNEIDFSQYLCVVGEEGPDLQIFLKSGDRFNYSHGTVTAFYAHDAFYKFPNAGNTEDFLGKRNMGTNDAVGLAKAVLNRLGCSEKGLSLNFLAPTDVANERFTRYFVHFVRPSDDLEMAGFEIDLQSKTVKSVFVHDPSRWNKPPKVNVPFIAQTNRPSL